MYSCQGSSYRTSTYHQGTCSCQYHCDTPHLLLLPLDPTLFPIPPTHTRSYSLNMDKGLNQLRRKRGIQDDGLWLLQKPAPHSTWTAAHISAPSRLASLAHGANSGQGSSHRFQAERLIQIVFQYASHSAKWWLRRLSRLEHRVGYQSQF